MFYMICFDISDDRDRYRVVKVLKGYGHRVQKSVFECPSLTEKKFLQLKDRLESLIDLTNDSIRYYKQCKGCIADFEISGFGMPPNVEDYGTF